MSIVSSLDFALGKCGVGYEKLEDCKKEILALLERQACQGKSLELVLGKYGVGYEKLEDCKKDILVLLVCPTCQGSKKHKCNRCKGDTKFRESCWRCNGSRIEKKEIGRTYSELTCSHCGGDGMEPREFCSCEVCEGKGKMPRIEYSEIKCTVCSGNGTLGDSCSMCDGSLKTECTECPDNSLETNLRIFLEKAEEMKTMCKTCRQYKGYMEGYCSSCFKKK